ncbi:hypothetical protein BW733_17330 [Tessaracoccus flavescens]|uniref:HipA-like C-terminal domain-containing protein n=1 Tax=Tessaracoccus flavescens TaxID=399497 RepID=A0A1Q2D1Z5_9ACTN|nr:hypothetical protein BW733_17330 [Tessaracoccus flavescens]
MGTLSVRGFGDSANSLFTYDPAFMYEGYGFDLAPRVPHGDTGEFRFPGLPLFLEDAGPDRWGRRLLFRAAQARDPHAHLDDLDYISGASDHARQGALRLIDPSTGEVLGGQDVPASLTLQELLEAADQVSDDVESFGPYAKLLSTNTSALGGARPKASIVADRTLQMAKFPMREDRRNVPAWEQTALDLAGQAGIDRPVSHLVEMGHRSVLLLERFDRSDDGRIPYMSFRTLMDNPDDGRRPPDYARIASVLRRYTDAGLEDLYRRVVFGVLLNNTDDHLRNLGLLRDGGGWQLAPMFDVNPEPELGRPRHTAIAGRTTHVGIHDALDTLARACAVTPRRQATIHDELADVLRTWRQVAAGNGINERETAEMAVALDAIRDEVLAPHAGGVRSERPKPAARGARQPHAKTTPASTRGSFAPTHHDEGPEPAV